MDKKELFLAPDGCLYRSEEDYYKNLHEDLKEEIELSKNPIEYWIMVSENRGWL